jgi:hypothetical protein
MEPRHTVSLFIPASSERMDDGRVADFLLIVQVIRIERRASTLLEIIPIKTCGEPKVYVVMNVTFSPYGSW